MVSRLKGEKSEEGCEASFLAGETSGLTNPIPEPYLTVLYRFGNKQAIKEEA